jgi:hypothetical protein
VDLAEELERIAAVAAAHAEHGEELAGVLPAEPASGERLYICAYQSASRRTWLAFDAGGAPVESRMRVRDAVSITALCEVAEESAGGGDLELLRSQLLSLRLTENPPGIDEAEEAALALEAALAAPPRVASVAYLDSLGTATRRLELALGGDASPFASAMQTAIASVESLTHEVESAYKRQLS